MSTNNNALHTVADQATEAEQLAQFLKASGDPLRIEILRVLSADSYSVQELCTVFSLKQSAMSHHLKVLSAAELVTTRREGNTIYYRRHLLLNKPDLQALQAALYSSIDHCAIRPSTAAGIAEVEAARITSSDAFFHENADKIREQQDLIASFDQYEDAVSSMLDALQLPDNQQAIEIGPGEGLFLPNLAKRFSDVTAYDTSSAMLVHAGKLVKEKAIDNVKLVLGDTRIALKHDHNAGCIVINMVLHHVANPAALFHDAFHLLGKKGSLVVTDLCQHDRDWAREACGDIWLGFEPNDLTLWAQQAGFKEGQASYLAQRNGFRIQIRHFIKEDNA